jgi:SAM-dependent methyltransferase
MTIASAPITHRPWWAEDGGFFGSRYMEGDDSHEGYCETPQTLAQRTHNEVNGVIRLLDLHPQHAVLDCPCGYGRHSLDLAQRGFKVVGVDINGDELAIARQNAGQRTNVQFMKHDMRFITFRQQFDAVINMFYSFGFFESDEENQAVLRNFYAALKPGGKFLMHTDVHIPRLMQGKYKTDEQRTLRSGKTLKIVDAYDPNRKRIDGSWTLLHPNGGTEHLTPYSVRVYTFEEFAAWCIGVGFTKVTGYGDWDGTPLSADSEDMLVVAEK